MTLDQLETSLDNMSQSIVNLTPILTEVGNEITSELRTAAPTGETGSLKASISLSVQSTQFSISMNDYGVYQNYGVIGYQGGKRAKDPRGGQVKPDSIFPQGSGSGSKYQFGAKQPSKGWGAYYTGFNKNIGWFDVDALSSRVAEQIQLKINQAFE